MDHSTHVSDENNTILPELFTALHVWYSNTYVPAIISIQHVEHISTDSEDMAISFIRIHSEVHPESLIVRVFTHTIEHTYSFQPLYERPMRPYFDVEEELKKLTLWCQTYFKEQHIDIREMAELPIPYPHKCIGYRSVVSTPNRPHGVFVDTIVNEDGIIIDFRHVLTHDYIPMNETPR